MPAARAALTALACAALVAGCGPLGDEVDGTMRPLADAVAGASASGESFRLGEVTDFAWDRVHFIAPYTPPEAVERQLGFEWDGVEDSATQANEGTTLIVFVDDGHVVRAFDHELSGGDFGCLTARVIGQRGLTRDEAVLRVKPGPDGEGSVDVVSRTGRSARCFS